jgi:hypothetical protein
LVRAVVRGETVAGNANSGLENMYEAAQTDSRRQAA